LPSDYEQWDEIYRTSTPEELPWELGRPRPQLVELIESGKIVPRGRALDVCCGLGTNTVYLAQAGFRVAALDISPTAVAQGRRKALEADVDIDFLVGNAVRLPFGDESFRFVLDVGCFHHIHPEDRDVFLQGIRRVLTPGGRYFVICFSSRSGARWNHFSAGDLLGIFSPYFQILEMTEFESQEGNSVLRFFWKTLMEKA